MVEDRERLAERLAGAVGVLIQRIAELRVEILAPRLGDGETLPDGRFELELLLRLLKHRAVHLRAVYREYLRGLARLEAAQVRCDDAAADLFEVMKRLRRLIEAERGTGAGGRVLGLGGRVRRKLRALLGQAITARSRLRGLLDNAFSEAQGREWLAILEPALEERQLAEDGVVGHEKRVQGLRITKDQALAAVDAAARGLVDVAVGYCRLLGEDELAADIRRAARRRRRPGPKKKKKGEDAEAAASAEASPGAEEEDGEATGADAAAVRGS